MTKKIKLDKAEAKKILIYGDMPVVPTGFATVTRNLAKHLYRKGFVVDQVGINYNESDKVDVPYLRYYRAARSNRDQDTFGRQTLINAINGMRGTNDGFFNDYDYVFMLQDPFIIDEKIGGALRKMQEERKQKGAKVFKTILYLPVDGEQYDKWMVNLLNFDVVIPFSDYGKNQIIESAKETIEYYERFSAVADEKYLLEKYNPQDFEKLKHNAMARMTALKKVVEQAKEYKPVYHGTDLQTFKPLPDGEVSKFRKDYFQENSERFIIGCVNRNQPRKDVPNVVETFVKFKSNRPDVFLYLHMDATDAMGMDLRALCNGFGLIEGKDYACMNTYGMDWTKVSPEMLNKIYNSLDVVFTATIGEGWGLTITEAMAAFCPVVAPRNTTIPEILGEGRGFIYEVDERCATHTKGDFVRKRRRGNIDSACEALDRVYSDGAEKECEAALKWVQGHTWEKKTREMIKQIVG